METINFVIEFEFIQNDFYENLGLFFWEHVNVRELDQTQYIPTPGGARGQEASHKTCPLIFHITTLPAYPTPSGWAARSVRPTSPGFSLVVNIEVNVSL